MERNINLFIYLFFQKDEEAFSILKKLFRPMVHNLIGVQHIRLNDHLFNQKDLIALADTVLLKSLYYFRVHQKTSFTTFYKWSLVNKLKDLYRQNSRHTIPPEVQVVCLDSLICEEQTQYLAERVGFQNDPTHDIVVSRIMYDTIYGNVVQQLSSMDKKILNLWLKGYRRSEISRLLKIKPYHVDKVLQILKKERGIID